MENNQIIFYSTPQGKTYEVILPSAPRLKPAETGLEDGVFLVECPSLSGCASQGGTVEEALAMIKDAIEGHIEVEAEKGKKGKAAA